MSITDPQPIRKLLHSQFYCISYVTCTDRRIPQKIFKNVSRVCMSFNREGFIGMIIQNNSLKLRYYFFLK
jgi:hypothetical protein